MSDTIIGAGHPLAIKKWSGLLSVSAHEKSYFTKRFIGTGDDAIIQKLTDVESDAGDTIQFDLSVELRQEPIFGDAVAEGNEENLNFYSDEIKIDQVRHPASIGGRMTRKRTIHNLRKIAKARMGEYFARFVDETIFIYLSGARGANTDFIMGTGWTGFAGNSLQTPDSGHLVYGGDATAFNNIDSADIMTRVVVERAEVRASMLRAADVDNADMQPASIEGGEHYVLVMSPYQEHSLRTASGSEWVDFQKAAMGAEGRNNPIFKGSLGMIKNVVLHKHRKVIRFTTAGSGANVAAARALFLGRQAGTIAFGTPNGLSFQWEEKTFDYGNKVAICAGTIMGAKKTRFNNRDFGLLSIDTAAAAVS